MYNCSACGLAVIMFDGSGKILEKPIKACECKAPIIVDMKSTIEGTSTAGVGTPIRKPKVSLGGGL